MIHRISERCIGPQFAFHRYPSDSSVLLNGSTFSKSSLEPFPAMYVGQMQKLEGSYQSSMRNALEQALSVDRDNQISTGSAAVWRTLRIATSKFMKSLRPSSAS
jgi:hypothetical protein